MGMTISHHVQDQENTSNGIDIIMCYKNII